MKRVWQYKSGAIPGFTKKYGIKTLVYYEQHANAESAIHREKKIKEWQRKQKLLLIEKHHSTWRGLYDDIVM